VAKTTDDRQARAIAKKIRDEFWEDFEHAMEPRRASKGAYKEELEELIADAQMRLEGLREEMRD
jgi:ABC-type Zn uptake system ZnuABC Zn-binding protein ZnuA